ncbi:MAG: hypothetical protein M1834_000830 [Cirrosporium novae-zelandiae]|nr:MAG: hypothetical protein M1834_000830 [Cirrosporium novae-zelandiae]
MVESDRPSIESETSPLLRSKSSNTEDLRDQSSQSVSTRQAVAIALSLGILTFLQGRYPRNVSLLTTTQSSIARDLNAFRNVSCGIGAAGVFAVSFILVLELTSKKRRGLFIGLLNSGYTAGVSLGAVIAGALEPATGWRAVFWIQSPLALVAGMGILFAIPKTFVTGPSGPDKRSLRKRLAKIDYLGMITLTTSIILLLFSLAEPRILMTPIVVSLVSFILFLMVESYYAMEPVIPIKLLKSRGPLFTCFAVMGFMTARFAVLFYTPVYAIAIRDWSPASAGLILIPTNVGVALGTILAGFLHIRRAGSFYISCISVFILYTASLAVLSRLSTPDTSVASYILATFTNGFMTGAALNYTLAHALHLTVVQSHIIVTPLISTFRSFSGGFGSAIWGGVFSRVLKSSLENGFRDRGLSGKGMLIRELLGSPATVGRLVGEEREVALEGYTTTLQVVFLGACGLALAMTIVQAGTGWTAPDPEEDDSEDDFPSVDTPRQDIET